MDRNASTRIAEEMRQTCALSTRPLVETASEWPSLSISIRGCPETNNLRNLMNDLARTPPLAASFFYLQRVGNVVHLGVRALQQQITTARILILPVHEDSPLNQQMEREALGKLDRMEFERSVFATVGQKEPSLKAKGFGKCFIINQSSRSGG